MILVNTDSISGRKLITLSMVRGSSIQSKHLGKDILSGLKNLIGGELTEYTGLINKTRSLATKRMVEEAEKLGADAVINIRYTSTSLMQGAAEVLVYGTAVKFEKQ